MNAYCELFSLNRLSPLITENNPETGRRRRREMTEDERKKYITDLKCEYPNREVWYDEREEKIYVCPTPQDVMKTWNIAWAEVECQSHHLMLPSNYTEDGLLDFLRSLKNIDYDAGFGKQNLFGTIVMKDGTWMTRGEYDGSEWWDYHHCPQEPDWEAWKREFEYHDEEYEDYS